MFDWAKIVLLLLQIVEQIFDYAKRQGYIQQGRDEEIAKQAQAIMVKTSSGKAILERINAMSDTQVDAELRGLEPTGTGGKS